VIAAEIILIVLNCFSTVIIAVKIFANIADLNPIKTLKIIFFWKISKTNWIRVMRQRMKALLRPSNLKNSTKEFYKIKHSM
jgi:hypothetical protein